MNDFEQGHGKILPGQTINQRPISEIVIDAVGSNPLSIILMSALRNLDKDQRVALCFALIERMDEVDRGSLLGRCSPIASSDPRISGDFTEWVGHFVEYHKTKDWPR